MLCYVNNCVRTTWSMVFTIHEFCTAGSNPQPSATKRATEQTTVSPDGRQIDRCANFGPVYKLVNSCRRQPVDGGLALARRGFETRVIGKCQQNQSNDWAPETSDAVGLDGRLNNSID